MTWTIRKSLVAAALVSAIAVLTVACGSDPGGQPGAPSDTPIPATVAPGGPASTAVSRPADPTPLDIEVWESNRIIDYEDLVAAFEAAGVEMAASDMVFPPTFFDVSGRSIGVGGNQDAEIPAIVFVFVDFSSRAEAQITVDLEAGVVGDVSVEDIDRLVLFGGANIILMYQGNDKDTIDLLSMILGAPFAEKSDDGEVDPSATIRKLIEAPIESVELLILESDPVQITVVIVAALPNGCHQPGGVVIHNAGNIFEVTVSNSVPALDEIACTQQFSTYEESVRLAANDAAAGERFPFQNGVTYTLVVNDKVLEFTNNGVQDDAATLSGFDALMLALARQDVTPRATGETVSGIFGFEAGIIKVGDADIQVHEFETPALASGAASGVTVDGTTIKLPDGSVSSVFWIAPPHFFLVDSVIALYVGDDVTVLSALLGVAGRSFAGSPIDTEKPLPEPTATPGSDPAPFPIPTQPAPIESVELAVLEIFPVQYVLYIVAGLENSCIEPYGVQAVSFAGADGKNEIEVEVLNVVGPPGTVCAELYRTYQENINLGSNFESGSEWDVFVNGTLMISFIAE